MTLKMTSLPVVRVSHVFQCLFTFASVSASRWLAEIWQLSRRGATGKLKAEFKFQRRSCERYLPFPAPPPERPGELARGLKNQQSKTFHLGCFHSFRLLFHPPRKKLRETRAAKSVCSQQATFHLGREIKDNWTTKWGAKWLDRNVNWLLKSKNHNAWERITATHLHYFFTK